MYSIYFSRPRPPDRSLIAFAKYNTQVEGYQGLKAHIGSLGWSRLKEIDASGKIRGYKGVVIGEIIDTTDKREVKLL